MLILLKPFSCIWLRSRRHWWQESVGDSIFSLLCLRKFTFSVTKLLLRPFAFVILVDLLSGLKMPQVASWQSWGISADRWMESKHRFCLWVLSTSKPLYLLHRGEKLFFNFNNVAVLAFIQIIHLVGKCGDHEAHQHRQKELDAGR